MTGRLTVPYLKTANSISSYSANQAQELFCLCLLSCMLMTLSVLMALIYCRFKVLGFLDASMLSIGASLLLCHPGLEE